MHLTKAYFIKVLALVCIVLALLGTLLSCSAEQTKQGNADRPLVVATIFPPYDFARNVAGDYADVELLVDVTDSHSYSPTAVDMLLIEECDIFIYTGGEGDQWAEDFLSTIDCKNKTVINMIDTVDLLFKETDEAHHDHEHDHTHDHERDDRNEEILYDEHVWLSPNNAKDITIAIASALCTIDPDRTEAYQANASSYCTALDALDAEFRGLAESAQRKTILVADRFPFRYLCEQYGLSYYAALPGCSSAADLTAVEYENLAEMLREEQLPVIFTAEYSDGTIARTVHREGGNEETEILTLHSCHTLTRGQISGGTSYLTLMRENIDALRTALG